MGAARSRGHFLNDRQVGLLLELALDDQVPSPRFEPERSLDRVLLVIHAQGEDEVRLGFPGNLEFDAGPIGEPEIAADRRAFAIGHRLSRFFAPVLLAGRLSPAEQPVRTQIDQVGTVTPAIDAMQVGPLDVNPAEPRDIQLDLLVIDREQGAEQDVARGQLETEIAGRLGQSGRRRPLDGVDLSHGEIERCDERCSLPAHDRGFGRRLQLTDRESRHWRVAAPAASVAAWSVPRRTMSRSRARPPRPRCGGPGETEETSVSIEVCRRWLHIREAPLIDRTLSEGQDRPGQLRENRTHIVSGRTTPGQAGTLDNCPNERGVSPTAAGPVPRSQECWKRFTQWLVACG